MTTDKPVRLTDHGIFPTVKLIPPVPDGYLLFAAEIDRRFLFGHIWESKKKRMLLAELKTLIDKLASINGVLETTIFKALIAPPGGRGKYVLKRPDIRRTAYDVVVLVRTVNVTAAKEISNHAFCHAIEEVFSKESAHTYFLLAENARLIAPVNHAQDGIFLFNYFIAENMDQNLAVWQYTAGWFQDQTGLDNSALLLPIKQKNAEFTIINHCRWNKLWDVLPALLFKRSFRHYVLAHFDVNNIAPMPILYRLGYSSHAPAL